MPPKNKPTQNKQPKEQPENLRITFRYWDAELKEKVTEKAKARRRSVNDWINEAVVEFLKSKKA